jgi:hypothetical protein
MRALALLLLGCSFDATMSDPLCRWRPFGSWTAQADGAAWVEGTAGVVLEGADYCPSERCVDVRAGETVIFLKDPLDTDGDVYVEHGRHCE